MTPLSNRGLAGILLSASVLVLFSCASVRGPFPSLTESNPPDPGGIGILDDDPPSDGEAAEDEADGDERSLATTLLLYLPNRVMDLFDMVRAGVDVGPGLGFDFTFTGLLNVSAMSRVSAGLGFQTLRHLPVHAGPESVFAAGPLRGDGNLGFAWHHSFTDIRIELHPFIVGAHAAVDVGEIADFVIGFTTLDIMNDDF